MDNATQLQNKGIEPTDKRLLILTLFINAKEPFSALSIYSSLKGMRIHRATVFRIIALFEKNNIVKRVDFNEGEYRFELSSPVHHHYAFCRTCGAIERVEVCKAEEAAKRMKKRTGFQVVDHAFTFFGVCKTCSALV